MLAYTKDRITHILLHVLLPSCHRSLAHLEAHLCCGIVYESSKRWVRVA